MRHVGVFTCVLVNADNWSHSRPGCVPSGCCPLVFSGQMGLYQGPCQHSGRDAGSCAALPHHSNHDSGTYKIFSLFSLNSRNIFAN